MMNPQAIKNADFQILEMLEIVKQVQKFRYNKEWEEWDSCLVMFSLENDYSEPKEKTYEFLFCYGDYELGSSMYRDDKVTDNYILFFSIRKKGQLYFNEMFLVTDMISKKRNMEKWIVTTSKFKQAISQICIMGKISGFKKIKQS